jgi:lauroyl/myristoyl acyltransferase
VGVEVEFLKRKLFLTSGWVRLAFITGSPILPTYIIRLSDGRHTVYIEPQFPLIECPDREEAIQRTAQTLMNHIEKIYRQYPHLIDWMSWQARLREASEHFNSKE